jgi:hypothetical protein
MRPRLLDVVTLLLVLTSVLLSARVADQIYERLPHVEDEFANLWQAEVMADGRINLPTPASPRSFLVPFVVDYQGSRFAKYTPGWPATLAIGARFNMAWMVNPLLAGIAVWLTYRLGGRLAGMVVGMLAAALMTVSPMFLMLSGSLMSHNLSLVLTLCFTLAWLDLFFPQREVEARGVLPDWLLVGVCASSMGLLILTRPLTAVGVALPFVLHGLVRFWRGSRQDRRRLLYIALAALALALILLLWQAALTGDPFLNLYTLWWDYDRVGFGPGIGRKASGHSLRQARINTRFSLQAGQHDVFGWPFLSWLFLPFGLLALRRSREGWLIAGVIPSLVAVYGAYWIGSWLYGPRYYYEGLPALAVISAWGAAWLGGWLSNVRKFARLRRYGVGMLLLILLVLSATIYDPIRVGSMHKLYGISRDLQRPVVEAQLDRALILVHSSRWMSYGAVLTLAPPFSETEILVAWSRGATIDREVIDEYSLRPVYHFYPGTAEELYTIPWDEE